MKRSLFLMLFLSTSVWAAEEPMPESCQKLAQAPQIITDKLDKNNPAVQNVIVELEKFFSELKQEWDRLQVAKASGKFKAVELEEAGRLIEEKCTSGLQTIKPIFEMLEAKKQ